MKEMGHRLVLVVLALVINVIFLICYDASQFFAISQLHGQVGYNIVNYHSYDINPRLSDYCGRLQQDRKRLIDFSEIVDTEFGPPSQVFPINDTIGYGVLLALIWKVTGSWRFFDVQILQIIIYAVLMMLFYNILLLLVDSRTAWYASLAHLMFFPLVWLNVQPVRDVWAYYGVLLLLYGFVYFLKQATYKSWGVIVASAILFSLCQFIRPSVFLALTTLSCVSVCYGLYVDQLKRIVSMLIVVWALNILFFWVPFVAYNLQAYHRSFVGPVGQDLLEGLGEFENPWGYKLCDRWLARYIGQNYHVTYGTPEFDDAAQEEFRKACKQRPYFYVTTLIKRIRYILVPALPWISPTTEVPSWIKSLSKWYMRLYILLGYVGFWVAARQNRWFFLAVAAAVLLAGLGKYPSHIEYRYLIPFYWVFSFGVGYLISCYHVWRNA